jgi:uncharacterized protein YndB with AHSA1/START domain
VSEPIKLRARVQAPINDVHHALTDANELRTWLAEHAEVELPHRYGFWGRYTPEGDTPHQNLIHVDDHTLRFSWLLDGTDTTVEIGLEEGGPDSTILTLSQTNLPGFADMVAETSTLSLVYTYWALAIANLVDHVEGRELTPKCDFTSPRMREQLLIGASPQAVYHSLADPETFARWFGAKIEIEPYVGGRWSMGGFDLDPSPAKIVELEPGRTMSIAWEGGLVSSWELAESDGKTRLTFVQSGFDERHPPYGGWMGWLGGIAELRRVHELRDWHPIWLEVHVEGMPEGLLTID